MVGPRLGVKNLPHLRQDRLEVSGAEVVAEKGVEGEVDEVVLVLVQMFHLLHLCNDENMKT
jgi:hypothetical protein